MDMSKLELTTRANYLIYNYIKKQLGNNDLAEHFRKAIQQSAHKDFIKFKGLEDLLTVLKNYYSSPAAVSGDTNSQLASVKEAGAAQHDEAETPPADCNGGSESVQPKKKKKNKLRKSEPLAEPEAAPVAPVMEQQEEPVEEEKRTKKKKKKRQLDAEQSEDAAPVNGSQLEEQEAEADAAAPPKETEAEAESEAPKSKKRKKQRRNTEEAAAAGDSNKIVDEEQSQQDVNGHSENGKPEAESDEKQTEAAVELYNGSKSGKSKRHNQPFRRVREEEVVNKHFQDNSFDAKPGSSAGWGYKANEDLRPTQGRSFRHEKTKKKRGSYKGGAIDTGVSSFKFGSDSE